MRIHKLNDNDDIPFAGRVKINTEERFLFACSSLENEGFARTRHWAGPASSIEAV